LSLCEICDQTHTHKFHVKGSSEFPWVAFLRWPYSYCHNQCQESNAVLYPQRRQVEAPCLVAILDSDLVLPPLADVNLYLSL
jgi:hypothetical protein